MKNTLKALYENKWIKPSVYIIIAIIFFILGKIAIDILFPFLGFEKI